MTLEATPVRPADAAVAEEVLRDAAAVATLRTPGEMRRRADRLIDKRNERVTKSRQLAARFAELNEYLAVAEKVTVALERLSEQLFEQLLGVVQEKLSVALQEILEQPIRFRAE